MHETGIAQSILDIAVKTALEKGAEKLQKCVVERKALYYEANPNFWTD